MLMLVLGRQQSSSASKLDQVSLLHGLRMVEKSNMNRKVAEPDLHVLEIVVFLVWLAVVSTSGITREENGCSTMLISLKRRNINSGSSITVVGGRHHKFSDVLDNVVPTDPGWQGTGWRWPTAGGRYHKPCRVSSLNSTEGKEEEPITHHRGFHMSPHMLQLGSRSLVVGYMLVLALGKQQSSLGMV
jgi:hypothetical protein